MSDQHGQGEQRGLGKVVYSTEPEAVLSERKDESGPTDAIEEASEESFPASDPPGYATGAAAAVNPDVRTDSAPEHPPHTEAMESMTEHDRTERDR